MACRSVATALTAVVAIVSTVALQGCGDDAVTTPSPGTEYFFQNLGSGACRNADGEAGEFTCEGTKLTETQCGEACLKDPKCVGFETEMVRTDPDANKDCTCELHTKAVTKVEPEGHEQAKCLAKVSFKNLGTGACRTADDTEGEYKCVPTKVDLDECRERCLGESTCVAFETNMERTDPEVPANKDCTCELHTKAVTKVELKDHAKAECYSVEKMTTETATYVV